MPYKSKHMLVADNSMIGSQIFQSLVQEFSSLAKGLAKGDYPPYSVGRRTQVPSFYYHKVDAHEFNDHLGYLKRNGYYTLTADEHCKMLYGIGSIDPKAVVLTLDDGLENLYRIAYPLLRKYRAKAIAFIIPQLIGAPGMITWTQAREMHESGWVDFQSHSLLHASIYVASELEGFFRGGHGSCSRWAVPWDVPIVERGSTDRRLASSDLGVPMFPAASRLSDSRRYFPDKGLEAACIEIVQNAGGESFFLRRNWQRQLRSAIDAYRNAHADRARYETAEAQRDAIRNELVGSKHAIEESLPGKKVKHFAFPWSQWGDLARRLLKDSGYESAYAGLNVPVDDVTSSGKVPVFARVNGDFVPRLSGKGQRSLTGVIFTKIRRRFLVGEPHW